MVRVVSSKFPARKRPPSLLHPPPRQRAQESASESKRLNPFSRFRLPDSVRRSASRNNEQYPANPLSIRDIIDYMTIAENEERNNRFFNSRIPQSSAQRPRNSNRPRTRFDRIQEEKKRSQSRRKTEPYSFLLDVYPYRNGGEVRTPEEFNSNRHPVTEAPSHQVDFQPETTTHTFWDLNSGDLSGYRVQYQDSNQLRYPSIGTIPPGVLPLETTTHFDSLRPSTESSSRQKEKQVIIHLNVYSEKSTDALGSRGNGRYRRPGDSVHKDTYLTPQDIYRSSAEARRNRYVQGETGSRGAHQRFPAYPDDYDDSLASDHSFVSQPFEEGNLYANHNMDDAGRYRRPGRTQYPSASAQSVSNSGVVPETLPNPMARK